MCVYIYINTCKHFLYLVAVVHLAEAQAGLLFSFLLVQSINTEVRDRLKPLLLQTTDFLSLPGELTGLCSWELFTFLM